MPSSMQPSRRRSLSQANRYALPVGSVSCSLPAMPYENEKWPAPRAKRPTIFQESNWNESYEHHHDFASIAPSAAEHRAAWFARAAIHGHWALHRLPLETTRI